MPYTHTRPYWNHFGPFCRCPLCGSYRVTGLRKRDHVDAMHGGLFHIFYRLFGGKLFHCRICRVQFFDRRPLAAITDRDALEVAGCQMRAEATQQQ